MKNRSLLFFFFACASGPLVALPRPTLACRMPGEIVRPRAQALASGIHIQEALVPCPVPECANSDCPTYNPATAFVRIPGHESQPIFERAGCFGIARLDANFYLQLAFWPGESGFYRSTSRDGMNWVEGPIVLDQVQDWWTGMKCPEPHFTGTSGDMVLYFKAGGPSASGIARAVSTDFGMTWTADPAPIITADVGGHYIDNPTVLRLAADDWLMAYTFGCAAVAGPFQMAEIHLAHSTDGISWTKSNDNPVLVTGGCREFDHGGVVNPVLLQDPIDPLTLHLLYTGAGWNGSTTRGCTKFGHAISTDKGRNWCKTDVALDHPPEGSDAWDDRQYMVGSYVLEDASTIRAYYLAEGDGGAITGLGVAEAEWPLAGCD